MRSSYIENNYGELLRTYVIGTRPQPILVELGVLDGYSTLHIARGLKELRELYGHVAHLDAYDLFDDYKFKHGSQEEVQKLVDAGGLGEFVNVIKGDAFEVSKRYQDKSIELLHVDISNAGDTLIKVMELWHPKMADKGILLFEGGSVERDQVDWMIKSGRPPIAPEIFKNETLNKYYIYGVYLKFPSMLVGMRKWWL